MFGLDIGSCYVKIVQLAVQEKGYKVIAVERAKILETAEAPNANANTITAIQKCLSAAQIKTKYAVCGLCGPDVATRRFIFPSLTDEEIGNAVLFEAEQVCPFDSGKFIVDYQILPLRDAVSKPADKPQQTNNSRGVLVSAAPGAIGRKSQLARAASISCVLMDVDGLALLNCFLGCEKLEKDQTIAILDVGSTFTNLAILTDNGLPFVRDISYAGDDITDYIATEHNLSLQVVRSILNGSKDQQDAKLLAVGLQSACTKLITEITETLRYYAIQEGKTVNRMLVCGGFAQTEGFIGLLNTHLPVEVILWNPLKKMDYDIAPHEIEIINRHGPSLALAAGFAMRTI